MLLWKNAISREAYTTFVVNHESDERQNEFAETGELWIPMGGVGWSEMGERWHTQTFETSSFRFSLELASDASIVALIFSIYDTQKCAFWSILDCKIVATNIKNWNGCWRWYIELTLILTLEGEAMQINSGKDRHKKLTDGYCMGRLWAGLHNTACSVILSLSTKPITIGSISS
jgi:hypothetical protein